MSDRDSSPDSTAEPHDTGIVLCDLQSGTCLEMQVQFVALKTSHRQAIQVVFAVPGWLAGARTMAILRKHAGNINTLSNIIFCVQGPLTVAE